MNPRCAKFLKFLNGDYEHEINEEKIRFHLKQYAKLRGLNRFEIVITRAAQDAHDAWAARAARDAWAAHDAHDAREAREAWEAREAIQCFNWVANFNSLWACSCEMLDCKFCKYSLMCSHLVESIKNGNFINVFGKNKIIVLTRPEMRFENKKFHSTSSPALAWEDLKLFYLHGINFGYELWEGIVKKTAKPADILNIKNQEQKSAAMRVYGYEHILRELQAKSLAKKSLSIGGKIEEYETLEVDLKDDTVPARFVKVICWSRGKTHLLRVDPRLESTKDPIGALAWTADVKPEEYILMKET